MHFLVTGASGFVGGALVRLLSSTGHTVVAAVRKTSNAKALSSLTGVRVAVVDFDSGEGLDEALAGVECVQHVAGVVKARTAEEFHRGNPNATRVLCEAIARQKKVPRLVVCSSLAAAGPAAIGKPRSESEEPAPISVYGKSKLAAEQVVRGFCDRVPAVILRPPVVYGPGDLTNVPPVLNMAKLGLYVKPGFTTKHLSFIHVDDLCEALVSASTRGKTLSATDPTEGVYFVSDPRAYSYDDFFGALSRALGKGKPRIFSLPQVVGLAVGLTNELAGRLMQSVPILSREKAREMTYEAWTCSSDRARAEIDFAPVHDLEGGLKSAVAWYRSEGLV